MCFEDAEAPGALQQSVGEYCGVHSIFSVVSKDMVSFSDVIKPLLVGCNPWFNVCHLSLEDHSRKDHDNKVMGPLAFLFACKNGPEEGGGPHRAVSLFQRKGLKPHYTLNDDSFGGES